ncbi:MAG: alanine--glyoxylate aminotransferase family protein [Oleiphilaceae bacterium]|nr:alanine--glyoxylate aminotransferase family protein [Oleiphilaceae bacterium]
MQSFQAPHRILMGPGPSDVSPRVLRALSQGTIGHLDPSFIKLMDEIKALLQYVFQTRNELTIPVSAPGSSGMETCFMNLLEPGEEVLVCINGVFGKRMAEVASRAGAVVTELNFEWGDAVDAHRVNEALMANPNITTLAFVHAETSTGVCSDVQALCEIAKRHNCLTIVDAVTSLGGCELRVDQWGIDAVYSGTQKCLSCIPGLSPVSFSPAAVDKIRGRASKNLSWFLDLNLVMDYWGGQAKRAYHHTAPVNSLYALHEALLVVQEEGIENAWSRHQQHHHALVAGLSALGIEFLVPENIRLPQLNAVKIPEGMDDAYIRSRLLEEFDLEIGAGLGKFAGQAWRIGLMGNGCNRQNVLHCVAALAQVLKSEGYDCDPQLALRAVEQVYTPAMAVNA